MIFTFLAFFCTLLYLPLWSLVSMENDYKYRNQNRSTFIVDRSTTLKQPVFIALPYSMTTRNKMSFAFAWRRDRMINFAIAVSITNSFFIQDSLTLLSISLSVNQYRSLPGTLNLSQERFINDWAYQRYNLLWFALCDLHLPKELVFAPYEVLAEDFLKYQFSR